MHPVVPNSSQLRFFENDGFNVKLSPEKCRFTPILFTKSVNKATDEENDAIIMFLVVDFVEKVLLQNRIGQKLNALLNMRRLSVNLD